MKRDDDIYHQLKQPKLLLDVVTGCIAVLGLFGCIQSDQQWAKTLSFSTLLAGVGMLAGNQVMEQLYRPAAMGALEKDFTRSDTKVEVANQQVAALTARLQEWEVFWQQQAGQIEAQKAQLLETIASLRDELRQEQHCAEEAIAEADNLSQRAESLQTKVEQLNQQIESLSQQLEDESEQFYQSQDEILEEAKETLFNAITEWSDRLLSAVESTLARREDIKPQLSKLKREIEQRRAVYQERIAALPASDDLSELVVNALNLFHEAGLEFAARKVRYRNTLNVGDSVLYQAEIDELRQQVEEFESAGVMTRSEHEAVVQRLKDQHEAILSEFEQNKSELLNDLDSLEAELTTETTQFVRNLIQQLELAKGEVEALRQAVIESQKPYTFTPATRDDFRMGNEVIAYFHKLGMVLDRAYSDYRGWEATLYFHIDRNQRQVVASELNDHSDRLQPHLSCLNVPKFEYDSEQGMMRLRVQISRKPKSDGMEIHKLWKRAEEFPSVIKGWQRVRITGGSESGKSPTAENLAVCLFQSRKDRGTLKLANPMHDSQKNHWTIPAIWTSHSESVEALQELAEQVENPPTGRFDLYVFDEVDSTIEQHKQIAPPLIKRSIKQASHKGIGMVFIGQNANASTYKGFDRSDWNNAVNLHIGANAYDAITNSNLFTAKEQNELKAKADRLTDFCAAQNEELGLEASDPEAYRFAFVVEPGRKPYFIELPAFGRYTFDQVESVHPRSASTASNLDASASSKILEFVKPALDNASEDASKSASNAASGPYVGVGCSKCETGFLSRTKINRGKRLYVCDTCGASTSESVLEAAIGSKNDDEVPE